MARGEPPIETEGRPHVNHNAMQHRDLLRPGPKIAKLRMKASRWQELACNTSKRKFGSATAVSSTSGADGGIQSSTDSNSIRPAKALKVLHHHFSSGEAIIEENADSQPSNTGDKKSAEGDVSQNRENSDCDGATTSHLTYKQPSARKWRSTRRQPRKYDGAAPASETLSNNRALRPRTSANYYIDSQSSGSADENEVSAPAKATNMSIPDERVQSEHLCTRLTCERPGCGLRSEVDNLSSASFSHHDHVIDTNSIGTSTLQGSHVLPHVHYEISTNHYDSTDHHAAAGPNASSLASCVNPPLSIREMAASVYPKPYDHRQALHPEDDIHPDLCSHRQASESQDHLHPALRDQSQGLKAEDEQAISVQSPTSDSPPVSPIATGAVWESRRTRQERHRRERELARGSHSTPNFSTFKNTYGPTPTDPNTLPPANPTDYLSNFSPNTNTFSPLTAAPTPLRYVNQDTTCLICLQPVTRSDLDLRCVACPRTFHPGCLAYVPPAMNQNWRCSLCYKEAWHGYGHLPAERDVRNPSLVERYRRRLLLAGTYADVNTDASMMVGRGAGGGYAESVRFWLDVDLDGGVEADQKVLVRMGVVNMWKLRVVKEEEEGDGEGGGGVEVRNRSVEEVERWGVALGMALQEEEWKAQELRAEIDRLKGVVTQKDQEIAELEGGL